MLQLKLLIKILLFAATVWLIAYSVGPLIPDAQGNETGRCIMKVHNLQGHVTGKQIASMFAECDRLQTVTQ
jgi:hypothetical protein